MSSQPYQHSDISSLPNMGSATREKDISLVGRLRSLWRTYSIDADSEDLEMLYPLRATEHNDWLPGPPREYEK